MCSIILKVLYLACIVGGAGLVSVSLGSKMWRVYSESPVGSKDIINIMHYKGLFTVCNATLVTGNVYNTANCEDNFSGAPAWRLAVAIMMLVILGLTIFAFGWWLVACIGCCCESFLSPPLPFLAILMLLLEIAATVTYAFGYPSEGGVLASKDSWYGWGFWLAIGAIGAYALATVIGIGLVLVVTKK